MNVEFDGTDDQNDDDNEHQNKEEDDEANCFSKKDEMEDTTTKNGMMEISLNRAQQVAW